MVDASPEMESKPVVIGGVVGFLWFFILFLLYAQFGAPQIFIGGGEPGLGNPNVLLLLAVIYLPGPILAGYIQSQGIWGGIIHGIVAAFLGMAIFSAVAIVEEVIRFLFTGEGLDALSITIYGVFVGLLLVVLPFVGAIGGVIGVFGQRLNSS